MTRVVCVGDVMMDVVAQLPGPLAFGSDTPAPISLLGGGSAANAAAWLVVAGVATTFVGRVGDDELGRRAIAELEQAGVVVEVGVDPRQPTGTCIVLIDEHGERTMVPATGANSALDEQAVPAELFGPEVHLHLSGYPLFNDGARSAALSALAAARERGASISVDAASAAPLRTVGARQFLSWLTAPLLLLANLEEARVLSGVLDAEECALALGAICGEVIVKRGGEGATWSDGHEVVTAGAQVGEMIDSTGAGDAFVAGVLAARFAGAGTADCLRAGALLAARAVGVVGGRPPQLR